MLYFRVLAHIWAENNSKVIIQWAGASYKDLILRGKWICVYRLLVWTEISFMSPLTGSYAVVRVCVWVCEHVCVCAPITTKSAENKISLSDIKETQEGRWSVFSHGEPHLRFSPTSSPVIPHPNPPILTSLLPPNHWVAHVAKCCTMSACPLTQTKHAFFETNTCDVQTSFSFGDLVVWDLMLWRIIFLRSEMISLQSEAIEWEAWEYVEPSERVMGR